MKTTSKIVSIIAVFLFALNIDCLFANTNPSLIQSHLKPAIGAALIRPVASSLDLTYANPTSEAWMTEMSLFTALEDKEENRRSAIAAAKVLENHLWGYAIQRKRFVDYLLDVAFQVPSQISNLIYPGHFLNLTDSFPANLITGNDQIDKIPTQIVVLGAGMDALALHPNLPEGTKVFEVEFNRFIIDYKKSNADIRNIKKNKGISTRFIEHTLPNMDELFRKLEKEGWDRSSPTVFFMEGIAYYLTVEGKLEVYDSIRRWSAEGSVIAVEDVNVDTFNGLKKAAAIYDELIALNTKESLAKAKNKEVIASAAKLYEGYMVNPIAGFEVLGQWKTQLEMREDLDIDCKGSCLLKASPEEVANFRGLGAIFSLYRLNHKH